MSNLLVFQVSGATFSGLPYTRTVLPFEPTYVQVDNVSPLQIFIADQPDRATLSGGLVIPPFSHRILAWPWPGSVSLAIAVGSGSTGPNDSLAVYVGDGDFTVSGSAAQGVNTSSVLLGTITVAAGQAFGVVGTINVPPGIVSLLVTFTKTPPNLGFALTGNVSNALYINTESRLGVYGVIVPWASAVDTAVIVKFASVGIVGSTTIYVVGSYATLDPGILGIGFYPREITVDPGKPLPVTQNNSAGNNIVKQVANTFGLPVFVFGSTDNQLFTSANPGVVQQGDGTNVLTLRATGIIRAPETLFDDAGNAIGSSASAGKGLLLTKNIKVTNIIDWDTAQTPNMITTLVASIGTSNYLLSWLVNRSVSSGASDTDMDELLLIVGNTSGTTFRLGHFRWVAEQTTLVGSLAFFGEKWGPLDVLFLSDLLPSDSTCKLQFQAGAIGGNCAGMIYLGTRQ